MYEMCGRKIQPMLEGAERNAEKQPRGEPRAVRRQPDHGRGVDRLEDHRGM